MPENTNIRSISADVYARVEYNTHIEIEVSDQATEEEIQQELDEAAQRAIEDNLQTYQGFQPEITITRTDEEEEGERKFEQGWRIAMRLRSQRIRWCIRRLRSCLSTPCPMNKSANELLRKPRKGYGRKERLIKV